jgi:hypothetical protein
LPENAIRFKLTPQIWFGREDPGQLGGYQMALDRRTLAPPPPCRAVLDIGDAAPIVTGTDSAGAPFSSADDRVVGHPILLAFCAGPELETTVACLEGLAHDAADSGSTLLAIVPRWPADIGGWPPAGSPPCRILADPGGALFAAFGVDRAPPRPPIVVLLDPAHRIALIGDGADRAALRTALADELGAAAEHPAARLAGHPPVLVLPRVLSPADRAFLIAAFHRPLAVWSTDGFTNEGFRHETGDFKVRHAGSYGNMTELIVQDPALQRFLDARLLHRVVPQIAKAFQTTVTRREGYRIVCYGAGEHGRLAPHRDNVPQANAHRRFTFTVNLNAPAYEGGELRFPEYGDQLYAVCAGTAVVWSAALLHEVLPVTTGQRFVCGVHLFGGPPA